MVRFAAKHRFDGQYRIEQFGTGVEVAFLGLLGDLELEAQRPQDGDVAVAEVGVVEDLAGLRFCQRAVLASHFIDGFFIQPAALVAEAAFHRREALTGVDQLNLALAVLLLAVTEHPDKGADAGVVEHLFRQGNDGFQPVVLDDPAANFAFTAARAAGEKRRAVEDDSGARAGLIAVTFLPRLELGDHVD